MIVCVRGAKNHSFPDFQEPRLELVMALFTPPPKPHPTKNLFARVHLLGHADKTKGHATRRLVTFTVELNRMNQMFNNKNKYESLTE